MHPHEAAILVTRLEELFKGITPVERDVLGGILMRYEVDVAQTVIDRYVQDSSVLDRGQLSARLKEEHNRRAHRSSPTAEWKRTKAAEVSQRDELLKRTPKKRLQTVIEGLRQKRPQVFKLLRKDPLESDIGRSLIYDELRGDAGKKSTPDL